MRRATTLTSFLFSRILAATTSTVHNRLLTTTAANNSMSYGGRRWISTGSAQAVSVGVAGALASVAAVASLSAQGVYAKEPLPAELVPKEVVLYQYEACPFCNKVKAFLDYYDIPYKIVEVNPPSKKEIKWSEYKKVPILMVDGEQLVDSSDGSIITWCMSYPQTYIGILPRLLSPSTISRAMAISASKKKLR